MPTILPTELLFSNTLPGAGQCSGPVVCGGVGMMQTRELSDVIYTAGKVFDNLRSGHLATLTFLENGDVTQISSRADLQLLQDLRDAAHIVVQYRAARKPVTAEAIVEVNAAMTRSAALYPGVFRTDDSNIGVATVYGDHRPAGTNLAGLRNLIRRAERESSASRQAAALFVLLAKAQPFGDGNKRTALLSANILLGDSTVLAVPYEEGNKGVSERFNDLLARAYIFDEIDNCVDYLVTYGIKMGR